MSEILLLCTANICRSPMAQALLARELADRGLTGTELTGGDAAAVVRSAGTLPGGVSPPPEVVGVMAGLGLDVSGHRSHEVTAADLARADLVLALAREHLRHAVVIAPQAWPRAFTIRELVRRGGQAGTRPPGESLPGWLARVHEGRSRMDLLGDSLADDVEDPIGGPLSWYEATAAELAGLTGDLAGLAWPAPGR